MSSSSIADEKDSKLEIVTSPRVKGNQYIVTSRDADTTLKYLEQYDAEVPEITPEQEKKLSRKVTAIILALTSFTNLLLYADKATLSYASIFDLWEDVGLTQDTYNNSSTLFYVGYMLGQINLILVQKFPIGRVMTAAVFIWSIIIFLTCTVSNHQGIYAIRFFLGFVESVAVPMLNQTMAQFLTKKEKAATAPLFYSTCLGVTIPVGFIAYGILYAKSSVPIWKLFYIIIGGLTLIWAVVVFFVYPNNPTDAVFLSKEERIWVIRRVQSSTGASIEQKVIKKYQIREALTDPISWLFVAFFLLQQLANNLTYQQNLLFTGIGGISSLDSTLVSVASGGFAVICCIIATTFLFYYENWTAWSTVFWSVPSFVACIAMATLPWDRKIALLAMLCLASPLFGIPWILMFSWNSASCSGYTKKLTRNAMIMIAYGVANIISPQLWREKDAPRFLSAWIVQIVCSFFTAPLLAVVIWFILKRRNAERLARIESAGESVLGLVKEEDGAEIEVNLAALDLTDLENEKFIYPL